MALYRNTHDESAWRSARAVSGVTPGAPLHSAAGRGPQGS